MSGRFGRSILPLLILTCLISLTLTGCDDATAPEAADAPLESATKAYNPNAPDFFQQHGDAALAEAQAEFEQEFPGAKVYGLTFAVDDGSDLILSGWCGSDGDPPFWPDDLRDHMEGWLLEEGGPEGYTVKALAALPPDTGFEQAAGLQVEEINPEQFPYFRATANGEVEPLETKPLPDPFSKVATNPIPDPFINVFTPLQVDGGVVPMAKSDVEAATARMAEISPEYVALFKDLVANDPVYIGEVEIGIERRPVVFRPGYCYVMDPPPAWCWDWADPCSQVPFLCEFIRDDYWIPPIELGPDQFYATPSDLYTLDESTLSGAQIDVIQNGDRIIRPTGTVVESVVMTPDFEGAGVERPY